MRRFVFIFALALVLGPLTGWSWAEKAYVTDVFRITLRTGPSVENKIIAMLPSGQPLEVLDSYGDWSHVRISKNGANTKEGWVLTQFLMTRIPWEMQASSLTDENNRLKEKLTPIEQGLTEAVGREQELTTKLQTTAQALNALKAEHESLREGSADYLELKDRYTVTRANLETIQKDFQTLSEEHKKLRSAETHKWFVIGALVLLFGLIVGLILGRKQKKPRSLYF
jgi:SH3 domain protein